MKRRLAPSARVLASLAALAAVHRGGVAAGPRDASSGSADPPRLVLPLDCGGEVPCLIQNYVDVRPGPGATDAACGDATYDGHKGVDFRLPSLADADAGVRVLAAAAGVVLRVRDGERDRRLLDGEPAAPDDRACGNGVVLAHPGGWESQYCHLRAGSIVVEEGEEVGQGDTMGLAGSSGQTEFAHVHFMIRREAGGEMSIVDPFDWRRTTSAACRPQGATPRDLIRGAGLWTDKARDSLDRDARIILARGFAPAPVTPALLERQHAASLTPGPEAEALIFFARFINLKSGDLVKISVVGPGGFKAEAETVLDRSKATYVAYAGGRRTGERWPAGTYSGEAAVLRGGRTIEARPARLVFD